MRMCPRKKCEPARREGEPKGPSERPKIGSVLRYRIELGSYRQGDRRFAIRASIPGSLKHSINPRPTHSLSLHLLPAYTPPVPLRVHFFDAIDFLLT